MGFLKLSTGDETLDRVQDNIDRQFKEIDSRAGATSVVVKGVLLGTSDTVVDHGLGRDPIGYEVVDRNAAQHVYTSSTKNNRPKLSLILKASGAVTVTLRVF